MEENNENVLVNQDDLIEEQPNNEKSNLENGYTEELDFSALTPEPVKDEVEPVAVEESTEDAAPVEPASEEAVEPVEVSETDDSLASVYEPFPSMDNVPIIPEGEVEESAEEAVEPVEVSETDDSLASVYEPFPSMDNVPIIPGAPEEASAEETPVPVESETQAEEKPVKPLINENPMGRIKLNKHKDKPTENIDPASIKLDFKGNKNLKYVLALGLLLLVAIIVIPIIVANNI